MARYGYWIMAFVGFLAAIFVCVFASKKRSVKLSAVLTPLPIFVLAGFILAKIFGIVSYALYSYLNGFNYNILEIIKNSGFVFYGGLLGFFISALIVLNQRQVIDIYALGFSLFHSIARVGCYFASCCFGKVINGVRVPVQIIESVGIFIIFAVLLYMFLKNKKTLTLAYFLLYAVLRFLTEFLRGDEVRGVLYISFSQVISVAIIIYVLINIFKRRKKYEQI